MTDLAAICPRAPSYMAAANTPLYLVHKLREDPQVSVLAQADDAELAAALKDCLKAEPTTLEEEVKPYIYSVALALKGNVGILREVLKEDSANYRWFKYISEYLLSMTIPTNVTVSSVSISPEIYHNAFKPKDVSINSYDFGAIRRG